MAKNFIELERDGYGFRYFFNAGFDKATGMCDAEGVEVYEIDAKGEPRYTGVVFNKTIENVQDMNDNEFSRMIDKVSVY
jgi:hypothetical protein